MKSVVNIFKKDLQEIANQMNLKTEPIVEINKTNFKGDFSTTIALVNAKILQKSPKSIAEEIILKLQKTNNYEFVEIAGPGFINVTLKSEIVTDVIKGVLEEKNNFGNNEKKNKTINVELVSANPTGWLHVGHARNAVIGDTLKNIFKKDGYDVQTEYYTNDAGNQINVLAVTVFVWYLKILGVNAQLPKNTYGGDMYGDIAQIFVDEYGDKFREISFNENLINDKNVHEIFRAKSTQYFLKIIKQQLKDFGVEIEYYSSEQAMYDEHKIEELLELYKKLNATYEKDGALWLKTTQFGDDKDRVLIKSDKTLTYIVPDLACHHIRIQRSKADKLINIWGGDHHGYIARLRAGLALLGNDPELVEIEMVQMVRLIKDGQEYKMSKRKGTAVWLSDLQEMVGKDSLRYMLASKTSSSHMDLDLDLLQQRNSSNPVYYAQYATARCNSILKQAKEKSITPSAEKYFDINEKERNILINIDSFGETIKSASKNRAPQLICDYIQSLVKQFHSYYSDTKIVDEQNVQLSAFRLSLVQSILQVLENAFNLIGISPLKTM
ncbi:arginyl-tRNA synthetase [Williamsoniiplasma somnilux]|uniref:Arginine--tRNA ligase n=1 Tax=Williamsoniiplasma somnilux TaxID=215578 RepID=A0A2K8P082_9MOLU|nr:arginine--tRNA ligase [Williamsoniiplasma somnilux]ATZ18858.1 arginyl-tRNA synthetase [Williamsoniiplasma somnilux]